GGGEREPISSATTMPVANMATAGSQGDTDGNGNQGQRRRPPVASELGSLAGTGSEWGRERKENLRRNGGGTFGIRSQGASLPYDDQFLDLDPTYKDAWGQPLLRVTYDFHENDYNLYRYLAERCNEIMRAMNPTRIAATPELEPYDVHTYQSTH